MDSHASHTHRASSQPKILHNPDEVLAIIIKMAWLVNPKATELLSLVCIRFRDVALRQLILWTCLSSGKNPVLFLEQSGSLPLVINVRFVHGTQRILSFLQILKPYASRWSEFNVEALPHEPFFQEVFEWMNMHYKDLQLDGLKKDATTIG